MTKTKISNGELAFETQGKGEPLILLHCGFFDSRDWQNQITALSGSFKVIAYDQRGFGQSSVPESPHSPVEDLREFLDAHGIDSAYFMGHSIGGQIAMDFAAIYPKRVKKLVLVSTALDGYVLSADFQAWAASIFSNPVPEEMAMKVRNFGMLQVVRHDHKIEQELVSVLRHNMAKILTWKNGEVIWPHTSDTQYLSKIKAPTLVITGEKDIEDILAIAEVIKKNISGSQHKRFDGADHMMNFNRVDLFNQTVIDFLKA